MRPYLVASLTDLLLQLDYPESRRRQRQNRHTWTLRISREEGMDQLDREDGGVNGEKSGLSAATRGWFWVGLHISIFAGTSSVAHLLAKLNTRLTRLILHSPFSLSN